MSGKEGPVVPIECGPWGGAPAEAKGTGPVTGERVHTWAPASPREVQALLTGPGKAGDSRREL